MIQNDSEKFNKNDGRIMKDDKLGCEMFIQDSEVFRKVSEILKTDPKMPVT